MPGRLLSVSGPIPEAHLGEPIMVVTTNLFIVALVLYCEAAGEPIQGKEGVATVILNEAKAKEMDIGSIVKNGARYTAYKNISAFSVDYKSEAWNECVQLAVKMDSGEFQPLADWTHYYNPRRASPHWKEDLKNVKTIGNHIFGTLEEGA